MAKRLETNVCYGIVPDEHKLLLDVDLNNGYPSVEEAEIARICEGTSGHVFPVKVIRKGKRTKVISKKTILKRDPEDLATNHSKNALTTANITYRGCETEGCNVRFKVYMTNEGELGRHKKHQKKYCSEGHRLKSQAAKANKKNRAAFDLKLQKAKDEGLVPESATRIPRSDKGKRRDPKRRGGR